MVKSIKKYKLTQEELASKIDIDEKHYGKLERGQFAPSIGTFLKLIKLLNIPLSEFGLYIEKGENSLRDELIKEIYLLNEKELEIYSDILHSIKKFR